MATGRGAGARQDQLTGEGTLLHARAAAPVTSVTGAAAVVCLSVEADVQHEVSEPQVKCCAAGPVHDERQEDDGEDDHHQPEEEHDDAGNCVPGH